MRDLYPNVTNPTLADVLTFCLEVARTREQDLQDFYNLPNVFVKGRKVDKVPTGSSDVTDEDRAGDFNYDTSYMYVCVEDGSSVTWRRATLGSW